MARCEARQLDLNVPLAANAALHEELSTAQMYAKQFAQDCMRLERESQALRQERDTARAEVQALQTQLEAAKRVLDLQWRSTPPAPLPDWLDREFRKLLTVAHPDRWATAGQDVAGLAHEVTVQINAMRERLVKAAT